MGVAQLGCGVIQLGYGVAQLGCGVAQLGCGVAQLVVRRFAVRQAQVRFSAQHLVEAFLASPRSDEETRRRAGLGKWLRMIECMNLLRLFKKIMHLKRAA
jgi:hypothetical protein